MKLLKAFLVLLFSIQLNMRAQTFSTDYNKIGKEEADLAFYAPDKSAEALVLFDIGKSGFEQTDNNFKVIFERTRRIKVFTDAGTKWGEVEIPFYHENQIYEKIYDIEAVLIMLRMGYLK